MPSLWGLDFEIHILGDYSSVHSTYHQWSCFVCCHVPLFATPWTAALQAPLSMGFPRQEYWNGLPFPSPWNLPDPGIESESLVSSALASRFFTTVPLERRDNPYYRKCHCVPRLGWKCLQTRISILSNQRSSVISSQQSEEEKLTPETHPLVSNSLRYLETQNQLSMPRVGLSSREGKVGGTSSGQQIVIPVPIPHPYSPHPFFPSYSLSFGNSLQHVGRDSHSSSGGFKRDSFM